MRIVKHLKTGNEYVVLNEDVIECTNDRADKGITYVVYAKKAADGIGIDYSMIFCREQEEFWRKFKRL